MKNKDPSEKNKDSERNRHQFINLIKSLLTILKCENKAPSESEKKDGPKVPAENNHDVSKVKKLFGMIEGAVGDMTSGMLTTVNTFGQIFSSEKKEKKKVKKTKRESFSFGDSDFYITGMNLKRKFLRMAEQHSFGWEEPIDVIK